MPFVFPGRRRYAMADIPGVTPFNPMTPEAMDAKFERRRGLGGLFGGRARGIVRREDGDPGTLLNHFLYGREGVEDMREAPLRRGLFGQRLRQGKIEEGQAETEAATTAQRQAMAEQFIAQIPAEQQSQARLLYMTDPEGFARRYLGNGEFQGGAGFTNAYRINPDGTVTTGGALPLRPLAPRGGMQQHPGVPEGFELE